MAVRYEGIRDADVVVVTAPDRDSLREGEALARKHRLPRLDDAQYSFARQCLARLDLLLQDFGILEHRLCETRDEAEEQQ